MARLTAHTVVFTGVAMHAGASTEWLLPDTEELRNNTLVVNTRLDMTISFISLRTVT
jgi:hypothetical protein